MGARVTILVSGDQAGGEFLTHDAVRTAYAELARRPLAMDVLREVPLEYLGQERLSVVVGSVTGFLLEPLPDGRIGITGRLAMKDGQPRRRG